MRCSISVAITSLAGFLLAGVLPAFATDGRTTAGGALSAGPGPDYHEVDRLGSGLNVTIYGCLAAWDWCDVSWRGNRGWIAAGALEFGEEGNRIAMDAPGPRTGIPVVAFHSRAYWDQNYSTRLWYGEHALSQ